MGRTMGTAAFLATTAPMCGDPMPPVIISQYVSALRTLKGRSRYAMAAHGGDLGIENADTLRRRLREILAAHGKKK